MKTLLARVFIGIVVLAIGLGGWFAGVRLEGRAPEVQIDLPSSILGATPELRVEIDDAKSGLRSVQVRLIQGSRTITLAEYDYAGSSLQRSGNQRHATLHLPLNTRQMGIQDGEAVLEISARDYAWRNWFHGNHALVEQPLTFDTRPPAVQILSQAHYINQGGSGLIIFRTSKDCPQAGVSVGDNYFPAYAGFFSDPQIYLAFFALRHNQGTDTQMFVSVTDHAGNQARSGFYHHIRRRTFKQDTLRISDNFLNMLLPKFNQIEPVDASNSRLASFLAINRNLRRENDAFLTALAKNSRPDLLWEGTFLRFPNSAPMAGFADHRKYEYHGEIIDEQVHLGVDLASTSQAPVPAANHGIVLLAEDVGIYGQTVVIDHGFGLLSLYAHLSHIMVSPDQQVSRGDIIGNSGLTGLAGGDHLHFSVLVHNTFVNPLEWWDAAWIENNITNKLDAVKGEGKGSG